MVLTSYGSMGSESRPIEGGHYHFISIQAPNEAKDPIARRKVRSHAVKHALEKNRKLQRDSGDNFRVTASKEKLKTSAVGKKAHIKALCVSPFSLSAGTLDPFETLAVNSSRLQSLLSNCKARQAPEPVFSVAKGLAFQNFQSVFRTGLVDPALLNALMLSFTFAVTEGNIDQECLGYQGKAISNIRENLSCLEEATSESTIGAILLLAGVEARLGMKSHVQLHMGAVQRLLVICQTKGLYLTGGIKRAIFWQDLNSSILAGSNRIVDHKTFAELQWTRDPFTPTFFKLPLGFQMRSHLLTKEFIEVLEDIHALQCIRDLSRSTTSDTMIMASINNHIASIQSRLVGLPNISYTLKCCHLAAYVCSVMLCCTIWCALAIPSHISSQLLHNLQQSKDEAIWDDHPELLLWLLYIGGAFAPTGTTRSGYVELLRANNASRFGELYGSWPELHEILKQFIWSEKAFMSQVKTLWEEGCT